MIFRRPQTAPALAATALAAVAGAVLWAGLIATPAADARSWVRIDGSSPIPAAKKLRYRVACAEACRVEVTARVVWPARPNMVNKLRGRLRAGESRANIVILNKVARNVLQANYRRSRLRVVVRATNRKTGAKRTVRRSFRFTYNP